MLYWRDDVWEIEGRRQIWSARIFKRPYLKWLGAKGLQRSAAYLFEGILVSVIVQIWLLPFVIVYFHRVTPAGIILNLWVGVCIAIESFAAVIAVVFGHVSELLSLPFVKIAELFNWLLLELPRFFVEGNLSSFRLPAYVGRGRAIYFVYFVPVVFLAAALYYWKPFEYGKSSLAVDNASRIFRTRSVLFAVSLSLVVLLGISIGHPFSSPSPDGRLRVDFLDVGQGDSALVTFPDGETILVDGGGSISFRNDKDNQLTFEPDAPRIGEAVVSEFLWEKGYSKIDYILATHADADHIQGLTDVARNFGVRCALFARTPMQDPEYAELAQVLQKRSIPTMKLSRGDLLSIGGVEIEALFPNGDSDPDAVSDNDHSLVLRLVYGSRRFLLTGDVERHAENEMLATPEFLSADVIKVPHHGSHTSSTQQFIDAVRPEFAIISVGRRSRFGHPHKDVVERWMNSGANVMTTGENGMISASTDGKDLIVKSLISGNSQD
jgi:competence protein ComEC